MKKLSHRQAQELLFADASLDSETRTALAEHIAGCSACKEYEMTIQRLENEEWNPYLRVTRTKAEKRHIARTLEEEIEKQKRMRRVLSLFPAFAWAGLVLLLALTLNWALKYALPQPASTGPNAPVDRSTPLLPAEVLGRSTEATPTGNTEQTGQLIKPAGQSEFLGGIAQAIAIEGNYAYVGIRGRLAVVDLTSLEIVSSVGYSPQTDESTEDLVVYGGYAYVANWLDGLYILDVRNPLRPLVVGHSNYQWKGDVPKVSLPQVQQVAGVQDGLAYIVQLECESPCRDIDMRASLRIIDVSDPSKPVEVGVWHTGTFNAVPGVYDGYAFLALPDGKFQILDVSDPGNIFEAGSIDLGGVGEIEVFGHYAYVLAGANLVILDISNPAEPEQVSVFPTDPGSRYHIAVSNGYAFLAEGSYGRRRILILDVSNPVEPEQVTFYEGAKPRNENPEYMKGDVAVSGDKIFITGGTRNVDVYGFEPAKKVIVSLSPNRESTLAEEDLNCDGTKERLLGEVGKETPYFNIEPQLQSLTIETGADNDRIWEISAVETGAAYLAYEFFQADDCNKFLVLLAHKGKESLQVFRLDEGKVSRVLNLSGLYLFSGDWQKELFGDVIIPAHTLTFVQYGISRGMSTWTLRGYQWDGGRLNPIIEERRITRGGG